MNSRKRKPNKFPIKDLHIFSSYKQEHLKKECILYKRASISKIGTYKKIKH